MKRKHKGSVRGRRIRPALQLDDSLKFDEGKPSPSLVPAELIYEISEILAFGADKYGPNNWRKANPPKMTRVLDSALRHIYAWADREDDDEESGKNHLTHAITQLMFLRYYQKHGLSHDDRWKHEHAEE